MSSLGSPHMVDYFTAWVYRDHLILNQWCKNLVSNE